MDAKLRELERLAAAGDVAAEQQLKTAQARLDDKPLPEPEFRIPMDVPVDFHCYGTVVAHVPMDADDRDIEEAARFEDLPRDWEYLDGSLEVSHEEMRQYNPLVGSYRAELRKLRDVLLRLWKQHLIWPITDVPNPDIGAEQGQDVMYDDPRITGFIYISAEEFDAWGQGERLRINHRSREDTDGSNEAQARIIYDALLAQFDCSWDSNPDHPIYLGAGR